MCGVPVPPPHSPSPFGSSLWLCPQGRGWGSEPRRCGGGGFPCKGFAAQPRLDWGGQHTSLSQGMKTLLLFPVASDGLTPLPSIATRTLPVPSLGSGLGRVGASPPPSSWAGSELGTQGGDSHPQQPNSSMQFGGGGGEDGPPSRSPATSRVWGTRFGPEDRSCR